MSWHTFPNTKLLFRYFARKKYPNNFAHRNKKVASVIIVVIEKFTKHFNIISSFKA